MIKEGFPEEVTFQLRPERQLAWPRNGFGSFSYPTLLQPVRFLSEQFWPLPYLINNFVLLN